jgi:pimeloyl-ACP methyl ester carboxylesterase
MWAAPVPMRTVWRTAGASPQGRDLLVFLPGQGDSAEDFIRHGFIAAVERARLPVDCVAVNATFGYYARSALVPRLMEDVITPARRAGYRRIWLVGISMGGLGAALTASRNEDAIDGLLLLAPYLGEKALVNEIAAAGGLARWTAPATPDPDGDYQRALWAWLKRYTARAQHPRLPELYLGFGTEDRFLAAETLLAAELPAAHVFRAPGKHAWGPWESAFGAFLGSRAVGRTGPAPL